MLNKSNYSFKTLIVGRVKLGKNCKETERIWILTRSKIIVPGKDVFLSKSGSFRPSCIPVLSACKVMRKAREVVRDTEIFSGFLFNFSKEVSVNVQVSYHSPLLSLTSLLSIVKLRSPHWQLFSISFFTLIQVFKAISAQKRAGTLFCF